jgi:hypothetical protein
MNIFSKLFGRKKNGSRLESDNKNATQEKCNSCSDVNFLDEWESLVAECGRCKRRETVKKRDRTWYASVPNGASLEEEDNYAEKMALEVIDAIARSSVNGIVLVCFRSGQAVHKLGSVMSGSKMLKKTPENLEVFKMVGSSPEHWQAYKKEVIRTLEETIDQLDHSIVIIATDAQRDLRRSVEQIDGISKYITFLGY